VQLLAVRAGGEPRAAAGLQRGGLVELAHPQQLAVEAAGVRLGRAVRRPARGRAR
jgi:hypothetical protein